VAARRVARPYAGIVVLLTALAVALVPGPTQASPHQTPAQVKAQIKTLEAQARDAKQALTQQRRALAALRAKQAQATAELARQRADVDALRARIAATADYAYRSAGVGGVTALAAAVGPTALVAGLTLDDYAATQAAQLAALTRAQQQVAATQARYAAQAAAAQRALHGIAAEQAKIGRLLTKAHTLLASLDPASEAIGSLARASRSDQRVALPRAAKQAAIALRFAFAQLGKPYRYGASGLGSYDCSGLTMRAWGAAGVALPHNAAAQQSMLPRVTGPLQPGDLVFEGSPAYHVGIYIGGGRMIHAPQTGDVVRIAPLPAYSSAGRP
jgi:cell wall-associated NlpC family hydrolase